MSIPTMSKVVLYDPAISSLNVGDHIISDSVKFHLEPLLRDAFTIEISSHLPVSRYLTYFDGVKYKFVCGSNLLRGRMNRRFRQWDVTPRYAKHVGPATLMGAGWWQYRDDPNRYTEWLYRKVLSSDYLHSVRDEFTADRLKRMGFSNVLNTSCPTMWRLDEEHCSSIPTEIAVDVVTTVTDYSRNPVLDRRMLLQLIGLYRSVKIWLQGTGDLDYLRTLDLPWDRLELIPPNLGSFDEALRNTDVDYVGTRLHAGIRALQFGRRSLIVGVDNRAAEKQKDFNLRCLAREDIESMSDLLRQSWKTEIRIPVENIEKWKSQFPELNPTRASYTG